MDFTPFEEFDAASDKFINALNEVLADMGQAGTDYSTDRESYREMKKAAAEKLNKTKELQAEVQQLRDRALQVSAKVKKVLKNKLTE